MNDFAIKIHDLLQLTVPSLTELVEAGVDQKSASLLLQRYKIEERASLLKPTGDKIIDDIYSALDLGSFEVGPIRFAAQANITNEGIVFGVVESDPLLVSSDNSEVIVLELGALHHALYECAKDAESFFYAAAHAGRFLNEADLGKNGVRQSDANKFVSECCEIAGGNQYFPFYAMLCGLDS